MILIPANDPARLLADIKLAIDAKRIRTWSYDDDGDFTHTAEQWLREAWLRPVLQKEHLQLVIIPPRDTHISSTIYAIYHGRFVEMVLRHFDGTLSGQIQVSIDPEDGDEVA
jgi:hypothetical protein